MRYAQLADFSSLAQLDQFVTNVPLSSFTRTVNVVSVQDMQPRRLLSQSCSMGSSPGLTLTVMTPCLFGVDAAADL